MDDFASEDMPVGSVFDVEPDCTGHVVAPHTIGRVQIVEDETAAEQGSFCVEPVGVSRKRIVGREAVLTASI